MLLVVTVRLFAKAQSDSTYHPTRPRLFFPGPQGGQGTEGGDGGTPYLLRQFCSVSMLTAISRAPKIKSTLYPSEGSLRRLKALDTPLMIVVDIPTDYSKNVEIGEHLIPEAWD